MGRPKKKQLNEWLRKRRKPLPKSLFKKKVMTDGMSAVYKALWAIRGRTNQQFTATHKEIGKRAGISPSGPEKSDVWYCVFVPSAYTGRWAFLLTPIQQPSYSVRSSYLTSVNRQGLLIVCATYSTTRPPDTTG